ncbi:hypothetical protein ASG51_21205 [Methylobacterium sp. Leaf465]|nr:hypothetical protein ASG51_21205 [Methylobacterium sp. Leaf465]
MQQHDTPQAVLARVKLAWSTRRSCGIMASAADLRIGQLLALLDAGQVSREDALRLALEAEATALCHAPLQRLRNCPGRISL